MNKFEFTCVCISLIVSLLAALFSCIYGMKYFFKKGRPLCMQSLTMAMGSHALGSIYQLCLTASNKSLMLEFTPAYLGKMGFFLFLITASYGHMDRIVDDGSPKMKPARFLALLAPVCAVLLYVPVCFVDNITLSTKLSYALVWITSFVALYYNFKHAIIPNLDFGFIKALKPYNVLALCLGFSELMSLIAWAYFHGIFMIVSAVIFSTLGVLTIIIARHGVDKWKI